VSDLGEYLRSRREELGLTQEQLASKIGVSQATVSQYEKGSITPRPRNLYSLAVALELSPDEVLAASGFYAARLVGERGSHPTAREGSSNRSNSNSVDRREPVERAAHALLAKLRECVGQELWSEVLVTLQRMISEASDKAEVPSSQHGDGVDSAEIAEVYESGEELGKRLPDRLGVSSPLEPRSGD
jgi:transcriptional regulator with XRE-family HTH domain